LPGGSPMEAIYAIIIFIVAFAVLNRIEFGRFD
jgi:ribose/xylose/arabinose/galactoside ABC-type transport system permease subunit